MQKLNAVQAESKRISWVLGCNQFYSFNEYMWH